MKKLLSVVLFMSALFLVACGSAKSELDGEYYWVRDVGAYPVLKIEQGEGVLDFNGTYSVVVNEKMGVFEISGFDNPTVKYNYKDGKLTADLSGSERDYYKKGTKAFDEALKENGLTEKDIKVKD